MNLRTTQTIVWTEPPIKQAEMAHQVRATISTFNALQHARYQAHLRTARSWLDAEAAASDENARTELFDVCFKWAAVLAGLVRLESRRIVRSGDGNEPWAMIELPADWRTVDGFLENVPAELAAAIYSAVLDLNPGLFGLATDDDAKKNGGISAG